MTEEITEQAKQELEQIQEQITQGQKAKEVLDNVEFQRWFSDRQSDLFDILDKIPLNDAAARQRACDVIYLFRKFQSTFKETVGMGEDSYNRWKEIVDGDKKKGLLLRLLET